MSCPSLEELLALRKGLLAEPRLSAVCEHLSHGCLACAKNLRWFSELRDITARDDSFHLPEHTIRWAVARFRAASAAITEKTRLIAQLVFDSTAPVRTAEVRSMAPSPSNRQMLYRISTYDIDVRLEQLGGDTLWRLIGQISSRQHPAAGWAGLTIRLVALKQGSGAVRSRQTFTDTRGMFHLRDIESGIYDLTIDVPEGELFIHGISCERQ